MDQTDFNSMGPANIGGLHTPIYSWILLQQGSKLGITLQCVVSLNFLSETQDDFQFLIWFIE